METNHRMRKKRPSWWRKMPGGSKAIVVVGIVCLAILILAKYVITMSSDPVAAAQLAMSILGIVVIIMTVSVSIVLYLHTANVDEQHAAIIQYLKSENTRLKMETEFYLDTVELQEIDLDQDAEDFLQKITARQTVRQTAPRSQTPAKPAVAATADAISPAVATAEAVVQKPAGEPTSEQHPKPDLGDTQEFNIHRTTEESRKVTDIRVKERTQPIDTDKIKEALREKAQTPQLQSQKPQDPPAPVAAQPSPQPKTTWPSLEEQATELGVPADVLRYYLRGNEHYSLLPSAEIRKLERMGRKLA